MRETFSIKSVSWDDTKDKGTVILSNLNDDSEVFLTITCPEDHDAYCMERSAGVVLSFSDLEGREYTVSCPQRKYYDPLYDSFCYESNPYEIELRYKRTISERNFGKVCRYGQCEFSYYPQSLDIQWEAYYDPCSGRNELKPILSNVQYRSEYERTYGFEFEKYPAHQVCNSGERYIAGTIQNLKPLFVGRRIIEFFGTQGCDVIRVKVIKLGPILPPTKWRDDD